jgi:hypothetical protein
MCSREFNGPTSTAMAYFRIRSHGLVVSAGTIVPGAGFYRCIASKLVQKGYELKINDRSCKVFGAN